MLVKATREGLVGQTTRSGYKIDQFVPFVALPSYRAVHRHVFITNPLNGMTCIACVLDIGPHFVNDDDYVFGGKRPRAETIAGMNKAGIDLGEYVWNHLGMKDNTEVDWKFIAESPEEVKLAT